MLVFTLIYRIQRHLKQRMGMGVDWMGMDRNSKNDLLI